MNVGPTGRLAITREFIADALDVDLGVVADSIPAAAWKPGPTGDVVSIAQATKHLNATRTFDGSVRDDLDALLGANLVDGSVIAQERGIDIAELVTSLDRHHVPVAWQPNGSPVFDARSLGVVDAAAGARATLAPSATGHLGANGPAGTNSGIRDRAQGVWTFAFGTTPRRLASGAALGTAAALASRLASGSPEPTQPRSNGAPITVSRSSATPGAKSAKSTPSVTAERHELFDAAAKLADAKQRDLHPDGKLTTEVAAIMKANDQEPSSGRNWAGDFVAWATAGAGHPLGPKGTGFETLVELRDWAKDRDVLKGRAHVPQPGDVVLLDLTDGGRSPDTAGIVESIDPAAGSMVVLRGNITGSEQVGDVPVGIVGRTTHKLKDDTIVGSFDPIAAHKGEVEHRRAEAKSKPKAAPTKQVPIKLDTDGDTYDRALYIAQEFEKRGMPGELGVATAMIESYSRLEPNVRNRIGYMGIFQTQASGRGGDGKHVKEIRRAERAPERSISKHYPAAHQIEDAATWFKSLRPKDIDPRTDDPDELLRWAMKAQGVNLRNNPHYANLPGKLPAARELLEKARERGPSAASKP